LSVLAFGGAEKDEVVGEALDAGKFADGEEVAAFCCFRPVLLARIIPLKYLF